MACCGPARPPIGPNTASPSRSLLIRADGRPQQPWNLLLSAPPANVVEKYVGNTVFTRVRLVGTSTFTVAFEREGDRASLFLPQWSLSLTYGPVDSNPPLAKLTSLLLID